MNAPASSGTSDSGAAAGSDSEQDSGSSSEQESTVTTYTVKVATADLSMGRVNHDYGGNSSDFTMTVEPGREVLIQAVPADGYEFSQWSDGDTNATRTITVNSDVDLTATFKAVESEETDSTEKSYTVTLTSADEEMGTVLIDGGIASSEIDKTVTAGSKVIIEADPESGYKFDSWSDGSTIATRTITVNSDVNLTAKFKVNYD